MRALGRTAPQTSAALSDALVAVLARIGGEPPVSHPTVSVGRLLRWHRGIFGKLFKRDAGRVRYAHEDAVFSNVYVADDGQERQVLFRGHPGPDIPSALHDACQRFADAQSRVTAGQLTASELAPHLAELMADILRIHPFVDGNHRVTLVAMQAVVRDLTGSIAVLPDFVALAADLELALLGPAYHGPLSERMSTLLSPPQAPTA